MRLIALLLAIMFPLVACASAPVAGGRSEAAASPEVRVAVTREAGRFTARYAFDRDAPVWAFVRSALIQEVREPWRPRQWTSLTPGVVLERRGNYDVLRSTDGSPVPRTVDLELRPAPVDLEADYATLIFSDGAVAFPTHAFDVFPLTSVEAADALSSYLSDVTLETGPAEVTWRDVGGRVLFRGERWDRISTIDANTYVLFGEAVLRQEPRLTTVLDPALPDWIPTQIGDLAPRIADYYAGRLGAGAFDRPTVMVSWNGPTARMTSMSGSVMPGLIVMSFEGQGIVTPDAEMIDRSRWFIAHESAHFWLGQTVRYERRDQAWITEGGADLMAIRAVKAVEPAWDDRVELQREVDDCVTLLPNGGIEGAGARGEHRAHYACGAVLALVAEAAQRRRDGGDWFDFIGPLIAGNRADEVLSRADWLEALTATSGDVLLQGDVERLLDAGSADPVADLAALFGRVGIDARHEDGRLILA